MIFGHLRETSSQFFIKNSDNSFSATLEILLVPSFISTDIANKIYFAGNVVCLAKSGNPKKSIIIILQRVYFENDKLLVLAPSEVYPDMDSLFAEYSIINFDSNFNSMQFENVIEKIRRKAAEVKTSMLKCYNY